MPNRPHIYVVDDDVDICDSTKFFLESYNLVVSTFLNPKHFIEYILQHLEDMKHFKPGCILLDVRMPQLTGLQVQNILQENNIPLPIIFVTSHKDVNIAVKAMKNGAYDFITKPIDEHNLLELINKAVHESERLINHHFEFIKVQKNYTELSNREKEMVFLLLKGMKNKVISQELNISIKTVEMHRANIMRKMETKSVVELAQHFERHIKVDC